ncbi:MAG: FAD-binding oxidoreductase [Bauldia sp.]|uniref:NAD(P)/FAD-dependent oxidoreductase n=1 Tax=Bauldia sp. TaxID=2575872 RepID=UPI001D22AA40|nr:FAD-dependent oxidoreductase [Bauldia sp.]MCB1498027.1 FAD-binding oxidoreductase [Bauldia sp.]
MRVLICGGGVIGAATAYFLARRGVDVTVVERTGIACAASGKSGGFLALDWCDGGPLEGLARRSYALHADLAEALEADYGYRAMTTYSGAASANRKASKSNNLGVDWISDDLVLGSRLGSTETTAQVDPRAFTKALIAAAGRLGAVVKQGMVAGLTRTGDGRAVTGATVSIDASDETLEADAVVLAMGPWSILASQWVPLPPVFGLKGHSLVFDTPGRLPPDALFVEYREASGAMASPEVFPRADGTTYVCGVSAHDSPLPVDPADVTPDPGSIERLEAICAALSPALDPARIIARQSCFRPVTQDGLPLIGAIPGVANAYVATGHSVWGMLNAPATGEAMAELILDGAATTIDISAFDPGRVPPFDASRLQTGTL